MNFPILIKEFKLQNVYFTWLYEINKQSDLARVKLVKMFV